MKKLLTIILALLPVLAFSQIKYDSVRVVKPQNFVEAMSIDTAIVQIISQKAGVNRRVNFQTAADWILAQQPNLDSAQYANDTLLLFYGADTILAIIPSGTIDTAYLSGDTLGIVFSGDTTEVDLAGISADSTVFATLYALADTASAIRGDMTSGVTSVATGYGLSGGPITTTGTISADTAQLATVYDVSLKQNILNGTGIVKSTAGTISYLTDGTANWNAAYNDKINSAAVTGTTSKTLTLTQQDAGTVTAGFTDLNGIYAGSGNVPDSTYAKAVTAADNSAYGMAIGYFPNYPDQTLRDRGLMISPYNQTVSLWNGDSVALTQRIYTAVGTDRISAYLGAGYNGYNDNKTMTVLAAPDSMVVTNTSLTSGSTFFSLREKRIMLGKRTNIPTEHRYFNLWASDTLNNGYLELFEKYRLANATPSSTSADTSFMVWIGNGSGTTPSFIEMASISGGGGGGSPQTIDTFSLSGNTLSLSLSGDGVPAETVDLSAYDQTLSTSNDTLTISGGNSVKIGGATTGRTLQDTILLDNIFGVYYSDYMQTGADTFIVAPSGHVVGSQGYVRFTSSGYPLIFSSDFNYIYGFTSGSTLANGGTYEIYFHKTPSGVSVNIPAAVVATSVNPLVESPYLALVADSVSTITKSSGKVSAWASVSPGTYTARQGTGANQPLYVNSTFDYVQFSRDTSQYLQQDTIAINEFDGLKPAFSFVTVISTQDTTNNAFQSIWGAGNGSTIKYITQLGYTDKDSLQIQRRADTVNVTPIDDVYKFASQNLDWHIIAGSCDGGSLTLYYDGVKIADGVAYNGTPQSGWHNRFGIGALIRTTVVSYADVRIRNLYMYNTAKTDAILLKMSNFLNEIYSLY